MVDIIADKETGIEYVGVSSKYYSKCWATFATIKLIKLGIDPKDIKTFAYHKKRGQGRTYWIVALTPAACKLMLSLMKTKQTDLEARIAKLNNATEAEIIKLWEDYKNGH